MQFDRGYLSPYFVTNQDKMSVELDEPYVLIHEKKLRNLQALLSMLEAVVQSGKPLLIRGCRRGIVAGGGVALQRASLAITVTGANAEQNAGVAIVRRALQAPARQIASNAGAEASIVAGMILDNRAGDVWLQRPDRRVW